MTLMEWKFDYTPADATVSSATLEEFYDPMVRVKAGDGKDSFEFKVNNIDGDYDLYYTPNSKIEISRRVYSVDAWSSSDVLMNGAIRQVPQTIDANRDLLRINGYNYSESVGGVLIFVDGGTSGTPIVQFLQNSVNTAKLRNPSFPLSWHPDNPTTTSTGGAFPSVTDKVFNKTLNYALEKYSKNEYTGDGEYYYYVDSNNFLIWAKRDGVVSHSFVESTAEHKSIKVSKDINDVKNYVIVKGGYDSNINSIQTYVADYSSIGKNGFKYYIFTDETKTAENNLNADKDKAGVAKMEDASYPFVPTWDITVSATNYDDYVDEFRAYHKELLKSIGLAFIETRKNGKLKVDITFQAGLQSWTLGQLVDVTISSLSVGAKPMRIEEIQYSTTTDTFTLVEDIGTI